MQTKAVLIFKRTEFTLYIPNSLKVIQSSYIYATPSWSHWGLILHPILQSPIIPPYAIKQKNVTQKQRNSGGKKAQEILKVESKLLEKYLINDRN